MTAINGQPITMGAGNKLNVPDNPIKQRQDMNHDLEL